jgi:hypothetical protein
MTLWFRIHAPAVPLLQVAQIVVPRRGNDHIRRRRDRHPASEDNLQEVLFDVGNILLLPE